MIYLETCQEDLNMNRVQPAAVCRQLIANLEKSKRLDKSEQAAVLHALEKTGIDVNRILANISKQALKTLLSEI